MRPRRPPAIGFAIFHCFGTFFSTSKPLITPRVDM
jgi:hypothetical protein